MVVFRVASPDGSYQGVGNDFDTTAATSTVTSTSYYMNVVASTMERATNAATITSRENDDSMMDLFGHLANENSSYQCGSSAVGACEEFCCLAYSCSYYPCDKNDNNNNHKPLWWLVLRWLKLMMFKMMQRYHAKPLVLMVAPLLVGLMIGYWLGQQRQQTQRNLTQQLRIERNYNATFEMIRKSRRSALWCILRWTNHCINSITAWTSFLGFNFLMCAHSVGRTTICLFSSTPSRKHDAHLESGRIDHRPILSNGNTTTISTTQPQNTITNETTKIFPTDDEDEDSSSLKQREDAVRNNLQSDRGMVRESGVPIDQVPKHIAVIMDGNRRYGKAKYGSATRGHWEGSSKLVEFAKWCLAEKIQVLTVFAFSSENWNREPNEVSSLMQIFAKYCDELRQEAKERSIKIVVLSTDQSRIPLQVKQGVQRMVEETQHGTAMIMNVCLSYGSRGELVNATKSVVEDVMNHKLNPATIDEGTLQERLLTHSCGGDPDLLMRTGGEMRISNFLLWQLAYTELFFVNKPWPAIDKEDLLTVIRSFAQGRHRRYGK